MLSPAKRAKTGRKRAVAPDAPAGPDAASAAWLTGASRPSRKTHRISRSARTDGDIYPGGDGVVNALSQMAMPADFKVLYGAVEDWSLLPKLYVADTSTEYQHETNTCQ